MAYARQRLYWELVIMHDTDLGGGGGCAQCVCWVVLRSGDSCSCGGPPARMLSSIVQTAMMCRSASTHKDACTKLLMLRVQLKH